MTIKNSRYGSRYARILLLAVFFYGSCRQGQHKETSTVAGAGETPVQGATSIKYAHGFSIRQFEHYTLVNILDKKPGGAMDTLHYLLLKQGDPVPEGYPGAQVIRVPVRTIIGSSSMHIALADFAGAADRIVGLGNLSYVSSPLVRENIKAGKVTQVGLDGNLNNELVISMHPDLFIAMVNPDLGIGKYKTITDAGVPVILNSEWLETSPLARAEWVKVMGALTGREAFVNKKFDSVAHAYDSLVQLTSHAASRPHVIIGMPYKGTWFLPGGEGYMAQFLRDAGAYYKWADTKGTASLPLSFESAAPEALTADYWLNVGYVDTKEDISGKDPRYAAFRSFKTGQIYNYNKRVNDIGSNDYWESGGVNPQLVLADMIRILHPELLPDHELIYYKQLK